LNSWPRRFMLRNRRLHQPSLAHQSLPQSRKSRLLTRSRRLHQPRVAHQSVPPFFKGEWSFYESVLCVGGRRTARTGHAVASAISRNRFLSAIYSVGEFFVARLRKLMHRKGPGNPADMCMYIYIHIYIYIYIYLETFRDRAEPSMKYCGKVGD
jgi:hypothetical protein